MRSRREFWPLLWALWAIVGSVTCAVGAPTLTISTPATELLTGEVICYTATGETQQVGPFSIEPGDVSHALGLPEIQPEAAVRVTLRGEASRRVARGLAKLEKDGSYSISFEKADFFVPNTLRIILNNATADAVTACQIMVTDSQSLVHRARATNIVDAVAVDIPDLPPGQTQVSVSPEALDPLGTSVILSRSGGVQRLPVVLGRFTARVPVIWNITRPIVEASGSPQGAIFRWVSLFIFILAILMWSGSVVVVTLLPQVFALHERSFLRQALKIPLTASGLILLGNGIGLVVVGEAQFLAVVSAIGVVQLALIFWLVLAVLGGRARLISIASFGVVAGMLASLFFVPALVVGREYRLTAQLLSLAQILLVLVSVGVIMGSQFRGWLREEARRSRLSLRRVCERCGEIIDPISGRCGCVPVLAPGHAEALGRLTVRADSSQVREMIIGTKTVIGRDAGCEVRLNDDPRVSRRHAVIYAQGKRLRIRDMGSSNGTFVNGQRISEHTLRNGDEIRVGDSWLLFEQT